MNISDWMIFFAVLSSPLIAVQVDKFIERRNEKKREKMNVFVNLMATRATPLSPRHVEALNRIDVAFCKDKKILDALKLLMDNFDNYPQDRKAPGYKTKLDLCSEKSSELLTDLLHEMGTTLGYDFDKVHLKRGAYAPQGHADIEIDQNFIRKGFVGVLLGKVPIPIKVVDVKNIEENKV